MRRIAFNNPKPATINDAVMDALSRRIDELARERDEARGKAKEYYRQLCVWNSGLDADSDRLHADVDTYPWLKFWE